MNDRVDVDNERTTRIALTKTTYISSPALCLAFESLAVWFVFRSRSHLTILIATDFVYIFSMYTMLS